MGGSTSQQSTVSSSEEPAPINPHHSLNKSSTNIADDEIDPAEVSIKASGCWDNHIRLTDCMSNSSSDWRKCQHEVIGVRIMSQF